MFILYFLCFIVIGWLRYYARSVFRLHCGRQTCQQCLRCGERDRRDVRRGIQRLPMVSEAGRLFPEACHDDSGVCGVAGRICNVGYQRWALEAPSSGWICKACSAFTGGDYYTPAQSVPYPVYTCTLRKTCNRNPGAGVLEFEPAPSAYGLSQDRTCTACKTVCPGGQRISAECADRADLQCTPCAKQCGMNQYLSGAVCDGTTRTDTVLAGCLPCQTVTDCVPGVTYHPGNCTGAETAQKVCSVCQSRLCSAGFYSGGCGGFSPTQCLPYTVCKNGTFLLGAGEANDGVCQPCRNCSLLGRAVETACGGQRNTGCGGDRCNVTSGCDETNNTKRYCNYLEDTGTGSLCGLCPVRLPFFRIMRIEREGETDS